MSWIGPDLAQLCANHSTVSICQPPILMFLALVTHLFGTSKDNHRSQATDRCRPGYKYKWSSCRRKHKSLENEYDFIIVGAGSAGCVVANRLSENPDWRVLLLEAGIEEPKVTDVPALAPMLQNTNIDWRYRTQPDKFSCRARPDQVCAFPRGKVMGGSSSINFMTYMRGNPDDYDEWARLGNHGWNYKNVLPYFLKSENNENPDIVERNPKYHHTGGYQGVARFPHVDTNVDVILTAWRELGYRPTDSNAGTQIGFMEAQTTSSHGARQSTNSAFLRPIRRKRRNLVIKTQTYVTRIVIDPEHNRAIGVEYLSDKEKLSVVHARKEVILSAGTINSPKILMLSGIGPKEHLESLGIPVIRNAAVGKNFQDHVSSDGIVLELPEASSTLVNRSEMINDVYFYKKTHMGRLSTTGPLTTNIFLRTRYEHKIHKPDFQCTFAPINVEAFFEDPTGLRQSGGAPTAYYNGLSIRPLLIAPRSRGYIQLNSSDPIMGPPEVYTNTFTEYPDLDIAIDGIEIAMRLFNTETFKKHGYSLRKDVLPACKSFPFGTRAYWACVLMEYTITILHPIGTCKMGPRHDRNAVVNPELKVYGISGLRVVDASVMPIIPRAHTNAATIMIAEKASDMIKSDWLKN